jgi:hypothetical protein
MIDVKDRILMIDTETTNNFDDPFVYDTGYQIFSLAEGTLLERSFVNADVFFRDDLMRDAYFADKIPQYLDDVRNGKRIAKLWKVIKNAIYCDCKNFDVKIACAHNAMFDSRALNKTQRYITTSRYRYVLPFGVEWWDTLKMARLTLKDNETYQRFCFNHGFITQNGQPQFTAEVIYRYLIQNTEFEEEHTGLEDVKIERKIFEYCWVNDPTIDGRLWV